MCCKIWNHPDVLYNFLLKREEVDIDLEPEDGMPLSPGYSGGSNKAETDCLAHYGKKEEINYDWTQVELLLSSSYSLTLFVTTGNVC